MHHYFLDTLYLLDMGNGYIGVLSHTGHPLAAAVDTPKAPDTCQNRVKIYQKFNP